MTGPFEISGDLPVQVSGAAGELPEHLLDVGTALEVWELARKREREAMAQLVAAVDVAREEFDEPLAAIVAVMKGRTRQYVQKLLRRARTEEEQAAYMAARYSPEASRRSLGRTGGYNRPQCPGCRAFLKHKGAQCSNCGFMDGAGYMGVPPKTSYLDERSGNLPVVRRRRARWRLHGNVPAIGRVPDLP